MNSQICIYYQKKENHIVILGYGGGSVVVLPKAIEHLPVTELSDNAFAETTETIPTETFFTEQSYTFVPWQAEKPIPRTIQELLQKIVLPDTLQKLGKKTFFQCTALTQVTLSHTLTTIPEECFAHCNSLKELYLPDNITEIEHYAFHDCTNLKKIHLPKQLHRLGNYVFYHCTALQALTLPANSSVGMGAFKNCKTLDTMILEGNTAFLDVFADLEQEVTLTIHQLPPDQKGNHTAKLLFPDFEYEYMENYPARQFKQMNYGSGYLYHQCIHNAGIDFARYDGLFSLAKREEEKALALQIALYRLQYPYKLRQQHWEDYFAYVKEHILFATSFLLDAKDTKTIFFFGQLKGLLTPEIIEDMLSLATKKRQVEVTSFLLDYQRKHFDTTEETFAL